MVFENLMRFDTPLTTKRLALRWFLLVVLLALEIIVITDRYDKPANFSPSLSNESSWAEWLFGFSPEIWRAGVWATGACLVILIPKHKTILNDLREQLNGYRWSVWLLFHILALATFVVFTALIFEKPNDPARLSVSWFSAWFALGIATLSLWLLALAPSRFWSRLVRRQNTVLLLGALLGISAWLLIRQASPLLWISLAKPTLQLVYSLLGWVYPDLVYQPDKFLVGIPSFQVGIASSCSGIEGIVFITLFLAIYLWLFRKDLRFPQAFWLFPLGIITIWLANAMRIAMLVVIGASYSPEVAIQGFHAHAGWIAFALVSISAIALSNRMQFFAVAMPESPSSGTGKPLAVALLAPFLVLMATSMLTSAYSSGFDALYPLRVGAVAVVLFHFRHAYGGYGWKWAWQAPAMGTAVFIIWMLLEPNADSSKTSLSKGLAALPTWSAAAWLAFRVIGSVIMVPLAEEFAFRGYLLRKLIAIDFENIPLGQFSWLSFTLTSVLFGLLHERWIAGTIAGMGYALVLHRRGQLGDAVVAHVTTNALIAIFVLAQGRWSLWT